MRWSSIDVHYADERIRSTGHGFAAIARTTLLRLLAERAAALGADVGFSVEVPEGDPLAPFAGCDLVVAADGVRSVLRTAHASQFRTAGAVATRLNTPLFRQLIESRDAQYGALSGVRWAEGVVVREPIVRPGLMRQLP